MSATEQYHYFFAAYVAMGYSITEATYVALVDAGLISVEVYEILVAAAGRE